MINYYLFLSVSWWRDERQIISSMFATEVSLSPNLKHDAFLGPIKQAVELIAPMVMTPCQGGFDILSGQSVPFPPVVMRNLPPSIAGVAMSEGGDYLLLWNLAPQYGGAGMSEARLWVT